MTDGLLDYLDVFIICASPIDMRPTLDLHRELVMIERAIRQSSIPIRLKRISPPTSSQLKHMFSADMQKQWHPKILHFIGHGDEDGLWFENITGERELITPDLIKDLIKNTPIELVFLNACWTAGKRILGMCDILVREGAAKTAVGHHEPIYDTTAVVFSEAFYQNLFNGRSVAIACQTAAEKVFKEQGDDCRDVHISGDPELRMHTKTTSEHCPAIVDDGMPTKGFLPGKQFFCGRSEEYKQISRSLGDPNIQAFGLWGIGGLGKTALALEVSHRNVWRYNRGGIAFIDIRDLPQEKRTVEGLVDRSYQLLCGPDINKNAQLELIAYMNRNPCLLIFDNLEVLPEAEYNALTRCIEQIPVNGSRILLTSRNKIAAVTKLTSAASITLTSGLDEINGVQFINQLAKKKGVDYFINPGIGYADKVYSMSLKIVKKLSGHPKMIELAVGIAKEGIDKLENVLDDISGSLESKLDQLLITGYKLVKGEGQRLLPFLALFPGGQFIVPELVAAISGIEGVAKNLEEDPGDDESDRLDWVHTGLLQLDQAALIEFDATNDSCSFHKSVLSESLKLRQLDAREYLDSFFGRLIFFTKYFKKFSGDFEQFGRIQYGEIFENCAERALKLMEELSEFTSHTPTMELDSILSYLVEFLGPYFPLSGQWRLGSKWNERIISYLESSSEKNNKLRLATLLRNQGLLYGEMGESSKAREYLEKSKSIFEDFSIQKGVFGAGLDLSKIARAQGNLSEAKNLLEGILPMAGDLGKQFLAINLHELAFVEGELGNNSRSTELIKQAIALHQETNNIRELAKSLGKLAELNSEAGNYAEAKLHLRQALDLAESVRDPLAIVATCDQLATIEFSMGNTIEARRIINRAIHIEKALGNYSGIADLLSELSRLEVLQGDPVEARRCIFQAINIQESMGKSNVRDMYLIELARIERQLGNFQEARTLLHREVELNEAQNNQSGLAVSLHQLGGIELSLGNLDEARRLYLRTIPIKEKLHNLRELAATLHQLAIVELQQGNSRRALELWEQTHGMFETIGDAEGQAKSMGMMAQVYSNNGDYNEALPRARKAVAILERIGSKDCADMTKALRIIESTAYKDSFVSPLLDNLGHALEKIKSLPPDETRTHINQYLSQANSSDNLKEEYVWLLVRCIKSKQTGHQAEYNRSLESFKNAVLKAEKIDSLWLDMFIDNIFKSINETDGTSEDKQSVVLYKKACLKAESGDLMGALELYEASLSESRAENNHYNQAVNILAIVNISLQLGKPPQSILPFIESGETLMNQLDDRKLEMEMYQLKAMVLQAIMKEKILQTPLEDALAQAASDREKAKVYLDYAHALLQQDRIEAREMAAHALQYAQKSGAVEIEVGSLHIITLLETLAGNLDNARKYAAEAIEIAKQAELFQPLAALTELAEQIEQQIRNSKYNKKQC